MMTHGSLFSGIGGFEGGGQNWQELKLFGVVNLKNFRIKY